MSWLFSQVLVEEYLGENFLDGEQSAPLSGSNTQQAYCAPDKMTDFSRLSQFGMMCKPLTESHGKELLTLYREGFHAKTSQQQEKAQGLTVKHQECGEKWQGSFVKYSPDTSSWKTHQCSLLGGLDEFSETWPQWGLMRDGECWEQRTLEQTIRGTGFGLSPNGVDSFHAPNTTGLDGGSNSRRALRKKMENWPTPCSTDYKGSGKTGELRDRLDYAVERGATKSKTYSEAPTSGQLNPDWVEWLMNWPIKWSDLNGFNKQEFQRWQEASAEAIQSAGQMRTMWWDSDPSQTPLGQQPVEQPKQKHSNSLPEMSWDAPCERKMERPQQGSDLSLLRKDFHIQETERKDLQQRMREQTCLDEAEIVPRVSKSVVARVDRLKAIGNGQVPLCAATAWRILSEI